MSGATEFAPTRKRHRGRTALIVVGIIVVLLVVAAVILDGVARSYAQGVIEKNVRSSLSVPAADPVDVTVDGTSVLYQLATGTLQQVDVVLPKVSVGSLTGSATATLHGIPLDQTKPIDGGTLAFSTDQAGLKTLLKSFTGIPVTSVSLASNTVSLGGSFTLLGLTLPVVVGLTPGAKNGELELTPKSFAVSGATLSAAQVAKTFGSVGADLTKTQQLCIANLLPKPLRLESVGVTATKVTLSVKLASVVLDENAFSTMGTCS